MSAVKRRLTRLVVENFKRLSAVAIDVTGKVTEISGKNGSGKTSTLDAIWTLFKGAAVAPTVPIHGDAEVATITGTLGDWTVTRTFKKRADAEVTTQLTIANADGAEFRSPQKKLDELIGAHMLDPLDFMDSDGKGRSAMLRRFAPDYDFERAELLIERDMKARKEATKEAETALAAASVIAVAAESPGELIDENALLQRIQDASKHNGEVERRASRRERHVEDMNAKRAAAKTARDSIPTEVAKIVTDGTMRASALAEQIRQLQARLDAIQGEVDEVSKATTDRLTQAAAQAEQEAESMQAQLDEAGPLPDLEDVDALSETLRRARAHNEDARAWLDQSTRRDAFRKLHEQKSSEAASLTTAIENRRTERQLAVAKAKIPVEGIGFGDGDVTLNGLPFVQASKAEQIRTATALSLAMNPGLPLVWIRDGSLLDDDSMAIIAKVAEAYDGQVFIETVRPVSGDAIVLVDGYVKGAKPAA